MRHEIRIEIPNKYFLVPNLSSDLAKDHDQPCFDDHLAGNLGLSILLQMSVSEI